MGSVEDLMIANSKTLSESQIVFIVAATLKGLGFFIFHLF